MKLVKNMSSYIVNGVKAVISVLIKDKAIAIFLFIPSQISAWLS